MSSTRRLLLLFTAPPRASAVPVFPEDPAFGAGSLGPEVFEGGEPGRCAPSGPHVAIAAG
jgi:hypothetical protein